MVALFREVRNNIVWTVVRFGSVVAVWTKTGTVRYSTEKSVRSNRLLSEPLTITEISMWRGRTNRPATVRI